MNIWTKVEIVVAVVLALMIARDIYIEASQDHYCYVCGRVCTHSVFTDDGFRYFCDTHYIGK